MIPRTFPSVLEGNTRKMVVYILPSVVGLQAWKDYIPVKGISVTNTAVENTYANDGYQVVKTLGSTTGTQAWVDYIPVYEDATLTKPWSTDIGGYIPASGLSSLNLDFTLGRLDPRITFSRTSNATLTGSNGLIQYAPHNLLTYSEQFDNAAWASNNTGGVGVAPVVTANSAVAPDGTSTADRIQFSLGGGTTSADISRRRQIVTVPAATLTFSFWARSTDGSSSYNMIRDDANGSNQFTVTGSWQRFSVTSTYGAGNAGFGVGLRGGLTPANSATADILIWGAQLEIGSTATTYTPTTVKNLLGYSQAFDNAAWTKTTVTVTANSFNTPSGFLGAYTLTAGGANSTILESFTAVANTPYTFSVWLYRKTGTGNVDITVDGTTWVTQSVTAGWTRFSTTLSPTAGSKTAGIRLVTSGDEVYAYGAQLSDSASLDPYVYNPVAAPAAAAYYGPRFDYDPVTLAPKGLLIEEQRTNLLTYSEQFDNAVWSKANTTITANSTAAPDGTLTADTLTSGAANGYLYQSFSAAASTTYVFSVWVKSVSVGTTLSLYLYTSNGGSAVASTSFTTTGNWQRVSVFGNYATGSTGWAAIGSGGTFPTGQTLYIWGAQLEAGAFATSYIPTVASQVTRAADNASMLGSNFSSWYRQDEGTIYAEASAIRPASISGIFSANGAGNNYIDGRVQNGGFVSYIKYNGTDSAVFGPLGTVLSNASFKSVVSASVNNFAATTNGAALTSDTSGSMPIGIDRLDIGALNNSAIQLNGHIKRITYFPRRLSNSELQSITA